MKVVKWCFKHRKKCEDNPDFKSEDKESGDQASKSEEFKQDFFSVDLLFHFI